MEHTPETNCYQSVSLYFWKETILGYFLLAVYMSFICSNSFHYHQHLDLDLEKNNYKRR